MEALYLRYRPQTLDELIGQETVKQTLSQAFANNKLSHAYLLVGPRGTGKTSTARILAKMVNCESSVIPAKAGIHKQKLDGSPIRSGMTNEVPCNKCEICLSITDGSNLDLIEIDAASNRGIDDIRTLREGIKLSPAGSKKKVYIIDEVHMLTTEAFNALLKTLEEPPSHAFFILATTDSSKMPQTILSRVQRLDFKLASLAELVETLKKVAKAEKMAVEEEALTLIAKYAEGSFRDCVKLLDQLASKGGKIVASDVISTFRTLKFSDLVALLENLASKQTKEALLKLNHQGQNGVDIKGLILSLMEIMRALLLIKNDLGGELVAPEYGSDRYEDLKKLAEKFAMRDLSRGLDALQGALEKLKFASILSLSLELAIVEICTPPTVIPEGAQRPISKASLRVESIKLNQNHEPAGPAKTVIQSASEQSLDLNQEIASSPVARNDNVSNSPEVALLNEKWTFVLETIRPFNFSLEALLRSAKLVDCNGGVVILEVPYSFHQRILETPKSRDLLESVLGEVLGKPAKVTTVLGTRPVRVEDIANVEIAADDEIIRAASEIFEGTLVD